MRVTPYRHCLAQTLNELQIKGVKTTKLQIDSKTGKHMAFFFDPDELPIELCET
jgi:glyoxylase I family protein